MKKLHAVLLAMCALLGGCASKPPISTVAQVDLAKFMGDWYVIAAIPTMIETESYNAVESYKLDADGSIATTFTFNKGTLDGEVKSYHPRGFVVPNTGNALWGMQFIWPIKAQYKIVYLTEDYSSTVIARDARDYVWIMARTPLMADAEYAELVSLVEKLGYDVTKLRKVPHKLR